jgi:uncharacterized protein DUF6677
LQSRDGVSENIPAPFASRAFQADIPMPFSGARRVVAVVSGLLIPGIGHLVLGRLGRGLLFFVVIGGSFVLGLTLNGRLYWPSPSEPGSAFPFDLISVLWFFAQIGSGICYIASYLLGFGTMPHPQAATFEYGNTFTFLAGLLNYLVVHDAYDIAAGRKR